MRSGSPGSGRDDGGAVPRRPARPGVRLAAAVLLAASVVAIGEAAAAAHLSARAALADEGSALQSAARALPELGTPTLVGALEGPERASATSALHALLARGGYREVRVVGADGRELLDVTAADDVPRLAGQSEATEQARRARGSATPAMATTIDGVVVSVSAPGSGQVLQARLDAGVLDARATRLRTPLLVVLVLGALACVPLSFLAGGARLVAEHRRHEESAGTDAATGLGNGRAYLHDLDAAVERARHLGRPLAVLLVQVEGLSSVADADGPQAATALARTVAATVAAHAGERGGEAYRLDDGRFAAVVTADVAQACALADRVRAAVATAAPLSADAAVAALDERCPDAEALRIGVEQALAQARERRSLVELFAAMARATDPAGTLSVTLPRGPELPRGGSGEGAEEPDIWDLDRFDDEP